MAYSIKEFYKRCDELFRAGDKARYEEYLEGCIADSEGDVLSRDPQAASFRIAVLNEAGSWYRGASNYARAEKLFVDALDLMGECGLSRSPHYARVLVNLAGLYRYTGELDKAEELFDRARNVLVDSETIDVVALASTMNNLALVYVEQGRKDDALKLARETYGLVMDQASGNDHLIATELVNIATLLLDLKSVDEAETAVETAIAIFERMPKENVHLAASYNTLAAICMHKRDLESAYKLLLRSLDSVERFYGKNIEYAICQENLARCAFACNMPEAKDHAQQAFDVMRAIKSEDDKTVKEYRDFLESIGA